VYTPPIIHTFITAATTTNDYDEDEADRANTLTALGGGGSDDDNVGESRGAAEVYLSRSLNTSPVHLSETVIHQSRRVPRTTTTQQLACLPVPSESAFRSVD